MRRQYAYPFDGSLEDLSSVFSRLVDRLESKQPADASSMLVGLLRDQSLLYDNGVVRWRHTITEKHYKTIACYGMYATLQGSVRAYIDVEVWQEKTSGGGKVGIYDTTIETALDNADRSAESLWLWIKKTREAPRGRR